LSIIDVFDYLELKTLSANGMLDRINNMERALLDLSKKEGSSILHLITPHPSHLTSSHHISSSDSLSFFNGFPFFVEYLFDGFG
tara:strand:- start:1685 stop:1936 length:252 start_codon:yes stop_codon:yes gene_type:complete